MTLYQEKSAVIHSMLMGNYSWPSILVNVFDDKGERRRITCHAAANNAATVNSDLTSHKHKPTQRRVLCFTNTSVSTNTNTQYTPKRFTDKVLADEVLLPKLKQTNASVHNS